MAGQTSCLLFILFSPLAALGCVNANGLACALRIGALNKILQNGGFLALLFTDNVVFYQTV